MLVCPLCRIVLAANESVCPRDGQTGRAATPIDVVPGLSKRFHFVQPFAHGDSGTLYLADEPETGRRGLLKVLPPAPKSLYAERQRLRRELVKQASLESAYVLAPFASGETEGQLWIFREWLEGVSLRVRLARQGALPQAQALSIAAQLAVALDELHRAGLLHRDLKPGHILLDAQTDGLTAVRIIDAGLCAPITGQEPPVLGTPGYVAPEQLSGKLVSFRSDLYALGCVLYDMLTGTPAFAGPDPQAVLQAQRDGKHGAIPENLPDGVSSLLRSLLGKDPQERPFSAQKLRRTLDPYLPDGASVTRQPTKTFASVPEAKKVPSREPTGTLRPPAPPVTGPKATVLGVGGPPPAARVSAPPPPPPSSRPSNESTQRLEIDQILASAPAAPRVSAPPPPPPSAPPPRASSAPAASAPRVSVPPPPPPGASRGSAPPPVAQATAPKSAAKDPTQAIDFADVLDEGDDDDLAPNAGAPEPQAEMTQQVRLDQVLAVAEAKKRLSVPPPSARASQPQLAPVPAAPTPTAPASAPPPAPGVHAPSSVGDQEATALHDYGAQPSSGSDATRVGSTPAPLTGTHAPLTGTHAPLTGTHAPLSGTHAPLSGTYAPLSGDAPASGGSDLSLDQTIERPAPSVIVSETVAAPDDDGPEGDPDEDEATSVSFKPAVLSMASRKRTLIGRAVTGPEQPAQAAQVVAADVTPGANYERRSEARSSTDRADYEDTLDGGDTFAPPRPQQLLRQYWPHAAAAILLLSVGGGLVAALSGDDEPKVASVSEGQAPAAAAAPVPAVMPMAVPPRSEPQPSVAPIAPPVKQDVEAADVGDVDETEEEESPKVARADSESRSAHPRAARSKRAERSAKATTSKATSSKAKSKSSGGDSKEERWAKAREEAQAFYAAKKYKQAAQAYELAAKNNPTHAGTFAGLGASRLKAGDARGAVQAYQKAVQLSPTTSGFHAALGRAYAATGDKSKARAAYKRALALDPKNEAAKTALKELG